MAPLITALISLFASVDGVATHVATTLDGDEIVGELVRLTADSVTIETEIDGVVNLSGEQLLELRRQEFSQDPADGSDPAAPLITVELVDGTVLRAQTLTIEDRQAKFETSWQTDPVDIPTAQIRQIRFVTLTPTTEPIWQEVAAKELVGDVLLIKKRDGESIDYLSGVVGDLDDEQVMFQWDGDDIPVKLGKVAGVVFYHAGDPEFDALRCTVVAGDGQRIRCAVAGLDGDAVLMTTQTGLKLSSPLAAVRLIDFSAGKVAYLSDLEPAAERWTPQLEMPNTASLIAGFGLPRRNASYFGSALTLKWPSDAEGAGGLRTYSRGLALRSGAELEYRLEPGMRRFSALAGIDPACADQGVVALELLADNRLLWRGVIDGREPPREIDVEIPSARRLRIVVDYGDNLDFGDRLHLVNAKVTK